MNTKNFFAALIFLITGLFIYSFVLPFKEQVVDNAADQLSKLESAYAQATQQLSLKALRLKKQQLDENQLSFLQNFIPVRLHSGQFVYNLAQLANQNHLTLKGLQYTVLDDSLNNAQAKDQQKEKRLLVEFTMDGKYEDFAAWFRSVERSNVLIDIDSFRGTKNSNNSDIITFNVKSYTYGISID
jgi:Tfp pilus assembly protein PilO